MALKKDFMELFRAGKAAAQQGDRAEAHRLLRRAIELDPYHAQVWLWLATVVDSDEDRLVCFQNALEIEPLNITARRQFRRLQDKKIAQALNSQADRKRKFQPSQRLKILFGLAAFVAALSGLGMIVLALLV